MLFFFKTSLYIAPEWLPVLSSTPGVSGKGDVHSNLLSISPFSLSRFLWHATLSQSSGSPSSLPSWEAVWVFGLGSGWFSWQKSSSTTLAKLQTKWWIETKGNLSSHVLFERFGRVKFWFLIHFLCYVPQMDRFDITFCRSKYDLSVLADLQSHGTRHRFILIANL